MTQPNEAGFQVFPDGWLQPASHIFSPNFDARPAHTEPCLIVIHAISLPPGNFAGQAVIDFFTNQLDPAAHPYFSGISGRRVSAHFFIRRDGQLIQFVSCLNRAWHAGVSCWNQLDRCNDFSIGIELEGDDHCAFTDHQYATLGILNHALKQHFPIRATVGHADIAPARKTDPGPFFDWQQIALA